MFNNHACIEKHIKEREIKMKKNVVHFLSYNLLPKKTEIILIKYTNIVWKEI